MRSRSPSLPARYPSGALELFPSRAADLPADTLPSCSIKPRSEKHIAIVKEAWKNAADMLDATGNYKEVMIR